MSQAGAVRTCVCTIAYRHILAIGKCDWRVFVAVEAAPARHFFSPIGLEHGARTLEPLRRSVLGI